jgi:hypothetical protein
METRREEGIDLIEVHSLDEIPNFMSEAEEAEWWSTHELSEELWRQHGRRVGDKPQLALPLPKQRRHGGPPAPGPGAAV